MGKKHNCAGWLDSKVEFPSNQTFSAASICAASALFAAPNLSVANLSSSARAPLSLQGIKLVTDYILSFYLKIRVIVLLKENCK